MKRNVLLAASLFIAVSVLTFSATGCNSGTKLYPLAGEVTYNGEPVPEGSIRFTPDASKGNKGAGHLVTPPTFMGCHKIQFSPFTV